MKKKELREQLETMYGMVLNLQDEMFLVSYENKRMADFLIKIGYTQEVLSDVIINGDDTERDELEKPLTMVKLENQMLRKTLYGQEQELQRGQENYNKLWEMYSELKKENKELKALLNTDIDTANVWTWKKKETK